MDNLVYILIGAALLIGLGYWLLSRSRDKTREGGDDEEPQEEPRAEEASAEDGQRRGRVREPRGDPAAADRASPKADGAAKRASEKVSATHASPKPPDRVEADGAAAEPGGERRGADASTEPGRQAAPGESKRGATAPRGAAGADDDDDARKERRTAFRKGLKSTRGGFIARLGSLLKGKRSLDKELLDSLEEVLLTADVGVRFTEKLKGALEQSLSQKELDDESAVWHFMRDMARDIVAQGSSVLDVSTAKPFVIMVVGVNGVGKTTTIAKLASRYVKDGKKVVLAAGDTFRAAAVRQLEMWGDRVGAEVVKDDKQGADPASVTFKAVERALEVGADVVIADTAGRLHTKTPLMDELRKVKRVMGKGLEGAPHEVLLVLDANTGQNANQQTREFNEALGVTGLVLTKLDGTAKGGVILGICEEHHIPVRFVGVGERDDDLREFEPEDFVEVLFERPSADEEAAA